MIEITNFHFTSDSPSGALRVFASSREPILLFLTRSREDAKKKDGE
jgi:hypothetical protein